jgi:hypothetical protein
MQSPDLRLPFLMGMLLNVKLVLSFTVLLVVVTRTVCVTRKVLCMEVIPPREQRERRRQRKNKPFLFINASFILNYKRLDFS